MNEVHDYSSENLRELRKNAGFSRRELLEKMEGMGVKMHPTTLRRIEDGDQNMKVHEAQAVAEIFGMSLDDLVSDPINEGEADIRSRLLLLKISEDMLMMNRHNWLEVLAGLADHIADGGVHPNQSKVTRDALQYMQDTVQLRDWLRSEDFPEDRNTGPEQMNNDPR